MTKGWFWPCAAGALIVASSACAKDVWQCTAGQATGLSFNKTTKLWEKTSFDVRGKKYLIQKDDQLLKWVVRNFADTSATPLAQCQNGFSEDGFLLCEGNGEFFKFNRRNLRYLDAYLVGYYNEGVGQNPAGKDSPYLEIGKCSEI